MSDYDEGWNAAIDAAVIVANKSTSWQDGLPALRALKKEPPETSMLFGLPTTNPDCQHEGIYRDRHKEELRCWNCGTKVESTPTPEGAKCHSNKDGDCRWPSCPQLRDGEPWYSGRHCPIDVREKEPARVVIPPEGIQAIREE